MSDLFCSTRVLSILGSAPTQYSLGPNVFQRGTFRLKAVYGSPQFHLPLPHIFANQIAQYIPLNQTTVAMTSPAHRRIRAAHDSLNKSSQPSTYSISSPPTPPSSTPICFPNRTLGSMFDQAFTPYHVPVAHACRGRKSCCITRRNGLLPFTSHHQRLLIRFHLDDCSRVMSRRCTSHQ